MRRSIFAILLGGALVAMTTLSGCPAAHDDYPGAACKTDNDCFQGEHCMNGTICVVDVDLSIELPDLAHNGGGGSGGGDGGGTPEDMTPVDL